LLLYTCAARSESRPARLGPYKLPPSATSPLLCTSLRCGLVAHSTAPLGAVSPVNTVGRRNNLEPVCAQTKDFAAEDVEGQAEQVMLNLGAVLEAAGSSLSKARARAQPRSLSERDLGQSRVAEGGRSRRSPRRPCSWRAWTTSPRSTLYIVRCAVFQLCLRGYILQLCCICTIFLRKFLSSCAYNRFRGDEVSLL